MAGKIKELSWSLSKARMFEECPRRYYYYNYFAQTGFAPDAPDDAKLALEMKRIKSLDMWVGEVVHAAIQWMIEQVREGDTPSDDEAKAETRRRLSEGWRASQRQLWRKNQDDAYPNLFEHYYGVAVGTAATDRLRNKAFLSVGNFIASGIFKRIVATPANHWLPIEKYASFRLDGLLMYVKFDFAMRDSDRITVYDWKTGKLSPEEARQLACYAMYTSSKWNVPVENVRVCAAHLQPEFDASERLVDEAEIEELRSYAQASFHQMIKCLRIPVRNIAAMEDFPMTGNLLRCARCNFRGICEQGKMASGDIDGLPIVEDWNE